MDNIITNAAWWLMMWIGCIASVNILAGIQNRSKHVMVIIPIISAIISVLSKISGVFFAIYFIQALIAGSLGY